jgi:hypothetical protein
MKAGTTGIKACPAAMKARATARKISGRRGEVPGAARIEAGRERASASSGAAFRRLQQRNARDHDPAEYSNNFHNLNLRADPLQKQAR